MEIKTINCKECGASFKIQRASAKFCSQKCKVKNRRRTDSDPKKVVKIPIEQIRAVKVPEKPKEQPVLAPPLPEKNELVQKYQKPSAAPKTSNRDELMKAMNERWLARIMPNKN